MRYVLLIHEPDITTEQISNLFTKDWDGSYSSDGIDISPVNTELDFSQCIWIRDFQGTENDYEAEEKVIFAELQSPRYAIVNYRDDKVLRKVLEIIAHNIYCYIDNDYGTILKGTDFMEKWSQEWSDDATLDWNYEYFDSEEDKYC